MKFRVRIRHREPGVVLSTLALFPTLHYVTAAWCRAPTEFWVTARWSAASFHTQHIIITDATQVEVAEEGEHFRISQSRDLRPTLQACLYVFGGGGGEGGTMK